MQQTVYSIRLFTHIVKRDGTFAEFNSDKITAAITKAGRAVQEFDKNTAKRLTIQIISLAQQLYRDRDPGVEEIQDIVEEVLLASPYKKTAKAYILYREQHTKIREINTRASVKLIEQYLEKLDWKVNENSNMSYSLQGLNSYISSEISSVYWLNKIYPPEIRDSHINGDLHIHDLGILSVYCVGWDLYDLLIQGFTGVPGKVESSPARHFRSALGQVVNFFYTLQGEAAGAQAFSNFDTLLAPFIRYDGLDYPAVKQAMQEFLFNINVPTRVGFQTPFTNLTFDLTPPEYFRKQGVVIGGKVKNETYGEFQKEMDMLNRAFLDVMLEGDAKGRVFTFPIPTYNITRDFDWDNPNISKLWDITAKYGIPYFANFINSDMSPDDARSMCCRLRIDNRELRARGGGLFGSSPLTGSIGVVTVNLPRLGILSKDEEYFFNKLAAVLDTAKNSLEIKRKILEKLTESNLYPYMKHYLKNIKNRFGKFWENHFSTIGILGMNEAAENLLNKDITSPEGKIFALRVMNFIRETLKDFQMETGNNYNLEATPAEGASYRLAMLDKKMYGNIFSDFPQNKESGNTQIYYTNSTQAPVDYSDDVFNILDHQDELQSLYTGGTVQHLFMCERIKDTGALKKLIKTICGHYNLPYFSITPTFSICPECGYKVGETEICETCGNTCEVFSRVVGYLRPVNQWNKGKQQEFNKRKTAAI